jgi:hypothetical protein
MGRPEYYYPCEYLGEKKKPPMKILARTFLFSSGLKYNFCKCKLSLLILGISLLLLAAWPSRLESQEPRSIRCGEEERGEKDENSSDKLLATNT